MDANQSTPITDADLEEVFASKVWRSANQGLIRLHNLLLDEPAYDLLPRVNIILEWEHVLDAHRKIFELLCDVAAGPCGDETLGRSKFSRGNMDEGPHAVALRLLGEQQALLQILERWAHRSRDRSHLAKEGHHDYIALRERFLDSYFGKAAPEEPHEGSEGWMQNQWTAAQARRSGTHS